MSSSQIAKSPSGRSMARFLRRLVLRAAALLVAAYIAVSVYYWWTYDVSILDAARGAARDAALLAIRAWVFIHDPCTVKKARLGPEMVLDSGYRRAEDFFATLDRKGITVLRVHNETIVPSPTRFDYQPFEEPR